MDDVGDIELVEDDDIAVIYSYDGESADHQQQRTRRVDQAESEGSGCRVAHR